MKYYIVGDSWGRGEWTNGDITHKGLEQYFIDEGFDVVNLSKSGGALMDAFMTIESLEDPEPHKIFCFVTDTSRGILDFWHSDWHIDDYKKQHKDTLRDYLRLIDEQGHKVYLIGGLTKVESDIIEGFKNTEIVCPSMIELIIPDVVLPEVYFVDKLYNIPFNINRETLTWIMQQVDRWDTISKNKFFERDGAHPDRIAHKILFDHIKKCGKL